MLLFHPAIFIQPAESVKMPRYLFYDVLSLVHFQVLPFCRTKSILGFLGERMAAPTVCIPCVWAGVDSAWEQEKPEARKIPVNRAASHMSGSMKPKPTGCSRALFVGRRLIAHNINWSHAQN